MTTPRFTDALGHGQSDKRIDILRGIDRTGSISQAARESQVSYKAAWQAIDTLTNLAGVPLVHRAVGGAGGGGASLTPQGHRLLELAKALDAAKALVQQRWLASSDAASELGLTPLALRTSMRNQLPATVTAIDMSGPLAHVTLEIGNGQAMTARVTRESVELLGLEVGMRAIALCKATSVRVARTSASAPKTRERHLQPYNQLEGQATGIVRGKEGDEVALALQGGGHLVGFAAAGSGIRLRHRVTAAVDETAVVIAMPG
jgi:molybdate transport system regulatory protein